MKLRNDNMIEEGASADKATKPDDSDESGKAAPTGKGDRKSSVEITVVCGSTDYGDTNGAPANARFWEIYSAAVDLNGDVIVGDSNSLRLVDKQGSKCFKAEAVGYSHGRRCREFCGQRWPRQQGWVIG